jgi:hypothetical protein
MTASEARKLTQQHSNRMQDIYKIIEKSAKLGSAEVSISHWEASNEELEALRSNGFTATYETFETDGGQYILIRW